MNRSPPLEVDNRHRGSPPRYQSVALLLLPLLSPLRLADVLAEVAAQAPALRVEAEAIAAAEAAIGAAGAWEDPTVGVMVEDLPLPGGMAEGMIEYRVSQPLNLFGRRAAAKAVARARHEGTQARRARVAADARAQASELFFEIWMIGEMDALMGRQIEALQAMHASARARYVAGLMMAHHDLLRAEAEEASMGAARASLADERRAMAAMLNTLRGRPAEDEVPPPELPAVAAVGPLERFLPRVAGAPELAQAGAMQREMAARQDEVATMYRPMVMVGGLYQQRLGGMEDGWGAEVALTVPIYAWDKQDHEAAMAAAMRRQADEMAAAMGRMTEAEVRMAWSRVRAAERALEALDVALPRMRAAVEADEAAYVAGTGDLLRWLEDQEALLRLEGRRLEATVARARAHIELERRLGEPAPVGP